MMTGNTPKRSVLDVGRGKVQAIPEQVRKANGFLVEVVQKCCQIEPNERPGMIQLKEKLSALQPEPVKGKLKKYYLLCECDRSCTSKGKTTQVHERLASRQHRSVHPTW